MAWTSDLALCQDGADRPVLYVEVGQWGRLLTGGVRRSVSFRYDASSTVLELHVAAADSAREPPVVLNGSVAQLDTLVTFQAPASALAAFTVWMRRTRWAPWLPVRAHRSWVPHH